MEYTLTLKMAVIQLIFIAGCSDSQAQCKVPLLSDSCFYREIMLDAYRLESYNIVYQGMYNGSVRTIVTEPRFYLTLLDTLGRIKFDEDLEGAVIELLKADTLIGTKKFLEEGWYSIAPKEHRIYEWRNRSEKRFLRKFFNKNLELDRHLDFEARLAFIVVLWEKRIPYRQTSYGSYIVTSNYLNIKSEDQAP